MNHSHTLAFIGGGNMASSLIGGLVKADYPPPELRVSDPDPQRVTDLKTRFGIAAMADNGAAVAGADAVVLAVKPQVLQAVARDLAAAVTAHRPLVVSVAAGVRLVDLNRWLGGGNSLVRAMPNTPALLGCGISALYANAAVTPAQRQLADAVLAAGGPVVWVEDEAALDAVTALSGGGPAYFFALMEYLERGGQALGLDAATARTLTLQTALGAARMALEDPRGPGALRAQVTSKAGTTERAIATFEAGGLAELVASALAAARDRARELGEQLGEDR